MRKHNKNIKSYMTLVVMVLGSYLTFGADVTWDGGGDNLTWGDDANWTNDLQPTSSDVAIITSGNIVRITATGEVCSSLRLEDAGTTLQIMSGNDLTVSGDVDLNSESTSFSIFGSLTLGGSFVNAGSAVVSFGGSSTTHYNGASAQTVGDYAYQNLTLSGAGTKTFAHNPTVSGTFTGNTATSVIYNTSVTTQILVGDYNNLDFQGTGKKEISNDLNVIGTFTPGSSPVEYNGSSSQSIIVATYSELIFSGSTKTISGLIAQPTTSFSTTATSVEYNGSGNQIILSGDYIDISLSSTGNKIITGTIGVSGTLTSTASIVTNIGTVEYNGTGAQTVTTFDYSDLVISGDRSSATVTFGASVGIEGTLSLTATNVNYDLTTNDNTISYNSTSNQTITEFTGGYNNVEFKNGVKQLGVAITLGGDLTIASSATLQTQGNGMTISGNFANEGIFTASASDFIRFSGSSASVISGASTTALNNLNVNKTSSSVSISGTVTIDSEGAITLENGTSTLSVSGSLTLLSTSGTNTARIAEIPSGSTVSGNIIVQRYVPISTNTLAWWHLSNSVQGVTVANWQSHFSISGNFTGRDSISASLAGSKDNWSLKTYDESQLTGGGEFGDGWKNFPTTTNTETFTNGQGYRVYLVDSKTTSTAKTLSFTGSINQGDFTFPMTYTNSGVTDAEGYSFLGNPYPSAIDFEEASWTKTNVTNAMYIWDAELKEWRGWANGSNYNGGTAIIPAGQGFWVQATGTPTLKVTESAKVSNSAALQRIAQVENNIIVSLEAQGSDDLVKTEIRISDLATSEYDEEHDMSYLSRNLFSEFNSSPLLDICSSTQDGKKLFVNYLPLAKEEIIPLVLTTTSATEYTLTLAKENYSLDSYVYLIDYLLNKEILIEDVTSYTFDIESGVKNRFAVKIDNRVVLATNEFDTNAQYSIYPNPASSKGFTVKATQSYEDVTVYITDILGNTIYSDVVYNTSSSFEKVINFDQNLESGIYFINFMTQNKTITQKVIIE